MRQRHGRIAAAAQRRRLRRRGPVPRPRRGKASEIVEPDLRAGEVAQLRAASRIEVTQQPIAEPVIRQRTQLFLDQLERPPECRTARQRLVEIEHAGKYKDFGDTFVRDRMSPETQEVLNTVLDDLYSHLLTTFAAARKTTPDQMRAIIDSGPFLAKKAKEQGLVDDLLYDDQVLDVIKKRAKVGELKQVSLRDYAKIPASSLGLEGGSRIALIVAPTAVSSCAIFRTVFLAVRAVSCT